MYYTYTPVIPYIYAYLTHASIVASAWPIRTTRPSWAPCPRCPHTGSTAASSRWARSRRRPWELTSGKRMRDVYWVCMISHMIVYMYDCIQELRSVWYASLYVIVSYVFYMYICALIALGLSKGTWTRWPSPCRVSPVLVYTYMHMIAYMFIYLSLMHYKQITLYLLYITLLYPIETDQFRTILEFLDLL